MWKLLPKNHLTVLLSLIIPIPMLNTITLLSFSTHQVQ
jgi:hypothetical protein